MYITCLDLEGVLVPEIWIAFSEVSGIPELRRTTRDEPDYDKLMAWRLGILKEHGLGLREIHVYPGTADRSKLGHTGLRRILCRSPSVQCTVCPPHGLAAGMGLCGAGCGFAGRRFAVWQRRIPSAGVAAGVE